ncbi:MAG TPA: sugar transferase [Gemmatimonadales bacterium]|nr:sugar transferase [Gemmatimonadales bacterium]
MSAALRRALDALLATLGLIATAPLLAAAALGIRRASPGPIFYATQRVGRGGRPFVMYKLRTMHVRSAVGPVITGVADARVFPFGALLRRTKFDELPQLFNVLRGDMAIVGPRPEDVGIANRHYGSLGRATLTVRPGLSSPGSIYSYTHGEATLHGDPEAAYVSQLLPIKLALDLVYVQRASLGYDLRVIARTLWVLGTALCGRRHFPEPAEMAAAQRLLAAETRRTAVTT